MKNRERDPGELSGGRTGADTTADRPAVVQLKRQLAGLPIQEQQRLIQPELASPLSRLMPGSVGADRADAVQMAHDSSSPVQMKGAKVESWKEVQEILEKSGPGQDALEIFHDSGAKFAWKSKGAGFAHIPDDLTQPILVEIGWEQTPQEAADYFIHEMHHVDQALKGESGDASEMGLCEFVDTMVREESDASSLAIRGKIEIEEATGQKQPGGILGEVSYRWAYDMHREAGWSKEDAHRVARDYLFHVYRYTDKIGAGSSLETYTGRYDREWNQAHGKSAYTGEHVAGAEPGGEFTYVEEKGY